MLDEELAAACCPKTTPLPPKLLEQLDCAPPELDDEPDSAPLGPDPVFASPDVLGPICPALANAAIPDLVDALELDEQLPELPLTCDVEVVCAVLDVLLQLYANVIFGVYVIRNVAAANTTTPLMNINLFMFVIKLRSISVICYDILKL